MKFKKPFKQTKFGKILTSPIIKGVLTKLPFGVGSLVSEVVNSTSTPEGDINKSQVVHHAIKLAIYAALIYAVLTGKITWDDAEQAKELLSN